MAGPHLPQASLEGLGFTRGDTAFLAECPDWLPLWEALESLIPQEAQDGLLAAVTPLGNLPEEESAQWRPFTEIQGIAHSLWLGEALLADRVVCYLQPIVDGHGALFGYESFARVHQPDDTVIGGYSIMAASRKLHIEYRLDRYLHHKAICAFAEGGYRGRLFINFFSGFIHRPEIYLDGLGKEIKRYGLPADHIVLDLTRPETQHNLDHLKAIAGYCQSQGYAIALDDISQPEQAEKLMGAIRADFLKIDHTLTRAIAASDTRRCIGELVRLAHGHGIAVIGEGVESETIHTALQEAEVDFFQGYHIGAPLPAELPSRQAKA